VGSIPTSSTKRVVSQLGDFASALGKLVRVLYNPKNNVVLQMLLNTY
jgi:hypothetical protein